MSYTPGPWKVVDADWNEAGDVRYVLQGIKHANAADARLIASAPDLLEALKWFVANDDTNEGDEPMPEYDGLSWNEINAFWLKGLNKARAAIAKAQEKQT